MQLSGDSQMSHQQLQVYNLQIHSVPQEKTFTVPFYYYLEGKILILIRRCLVILGCWVYFISIKLSDALH